MKKLIALIIVISLFAVNHNASAQKVIKKISDDVCKCVEKLVKNDEVDESTGADELMEKCMLRSFEQFEKDLRKEFGDDFYDNPSEQAIYDLGIEVGKMLLSDCQGFLDIVVAHEKNSDSNASTIYNRGETYYKEGKYQEAINEYDKAILMEPGNAEFHNSRGVTYYQLKQYYYAISDFINAIRLKSNHTLAYYNLAHSKYNLGDYDAALEDIETTILYNPDYCSALNLRGLIYNQKEDTESAFTSFQEASKCDPEVPLYFYNMAYMKYTDGDYEHAVSCFTKSLEKGYSSADIFSYLGNSLDQLEEYNDAVEAHTKYISAYPDDYIGFYNRGLAYYHANDFESAMEDFKSSVDLNAEDSDVFLKLAQCFAKTDQIDQARENFNRIIEMEPENAEFYDERAAFFADNKDYQLAIEDAQKSLDIYPNDCNVYMLMSTWYAAMGDEANAQAARQTGLGMGCEE